MLTGKKTWTMTIEGYGEDVQQAVWGITQALQGQTINRFKIERAGEPDLYPAFAQPVPPESPTPMDSTVLEENGEGGTTPQ